MELRVRKNYTRVDMFSLFRLFWTNGKCAAKCSSFSCRRQRENIFFQVEPCVENQT